MAYANSVDPGQTQVKVSSVCHFTKYFKKQLH